jgi:hypothetical protein
MELKRSADARALLLSRAAVLVEGETELGALPVWFEERHGKTARWARRWRCTAWAVTRTSSATCGTCDVSAFRSRSSVTDRSLARYQGSRRPCARLVGASARTGHGSRLAGLSRCNAGMPACRTCRRAGHVGAHPLDRRGALPGTRVVRRLYDSPERGRSAAIRGRRQEGSDRSLRRGNTAMSRADRAAVRKYAGSAPPRRRWTWRKESWHCRRCGSVARPQGQRCQRQSPLNHLMVATSTPAGA